MPENEQEKMTRKELLEIIAQAAREGWEELDLSDSGAGYDVIDPSGIGQKRASMICRVDVKSYRAIAAHKEEPGDDRQSANHP